jgi:ATP-dependent Clp protease protease subunit
MNPKTPTETPVREKSKVNMSPPTPRRFWNWVNDEGSDARTLYINGVIAEESWYGDEVTPALFRAELLSGSGDIEVWINSVGGDCIAAAQIYNMLMDYPHNVTVKIDGIAASAASVISMAGTKVLMSPVSVMFVHNPLTVAIGNSEEMQKAIAMLDEVKEAILNAYEIKTGMSRAKLSHLMDSETWMSANKAVELGFADGILFKDTEEPQDNPFASNSFTFSRRAVTNSLLDKLKISRQQKESSKVEAPTKPIAEKAADTGVKSDDLYKRLFVIQH